MNFKGSVGQAHGRRATFVPGLGVSVCDAVRASCSAFPFFERTVVTTGDNDRIELIDGGYSMMFRPFASARHICSSSAYAGKNYRVFLQGSYGNDTNIYAEGDVDMVLVLDDLVLNDTSRLAGSDATAISRNFSPGL
jgi:hypothetical protein